MRSDWLEAFLAFSESMNFTRAAEALHLSQPALHVKIGKLAARLEQPLYTKVGRTLVLTPAGKRLAAFAREQRDQSHAFLNELRHGTDREPVVLCAGDGAYLYLLGPALSRFTKQARHPLSLRSGDGARTVALLLAAEAHLGVAALDATPPGIASEELTLVDQVLVVPKDHRLAKRRKIGLADLEDETLVVPPQGRPHRTMINRLLMSAGVSWRVAVEAGGWELMLHFVSLGVGSAIVNGCCRLPRGLVAKPLAAMPGIRYQILQRSDAPPHVGAAALRRLLLANRDAWRLGR